MSRGPWHSVLIALLASGLAAEERRESFDEDPGWDGHNHRSRVPAVRMIRQDFGYSPGHHAGGESAGELGGFITPAGEPAYYAKKIPPRTFDDTLKASGTLACTGRQFHALIAFFNAKSVNEWRTPNSIALRLYGRGEVFYAFVEYATARWRAGGDSPRPFAQIRDPETGRALLRGFASGGAVHRWSLEYDPDGNDGGGTVTATVGSETAVCHLDPGHKADGAVFDRFGLLNVVKHADTGGELWLDDVTVAGETESFTAGPGWDGYQNRRSYVSKDVRPRFDFGYSATQYAGGERKGELGGAVFRGDNRHPDRMAYYADRVDSLILNRPLKASGKVCLRRGVSDSTTLIGFFHSKRSMKVSESQASAIPESFLGLAVEGPSREGFLVYPVYHVDGGGPGHATGERPHILPDGKPHDWRLGYVPATGDGGKGRMTVSLDGKSVTIDVPPPSQPAAGARFDRFGIITTWIDGNGQHIYFDDLRYTFKQDEA